MQAASSQATTYNGARLDEFLSLFPNRVKGILRPPGCKTWVTVSKHFPISDETLLAAVAGQEANFWGLRWGEQTRHAVFDIDANGPYHNVQELQKLTSSLSQVGLTATIYQSSDSRGWHLYLFFDDWQNCDEVQETLKAWLRAHGYEIRNGILEVFPSKMGLRLPLQPGFAWLAPDGNVLLRREELTTDQALSRFLDDSRARASDWLESKSLIESQLEVIDRAAGGAGAAHKKVIDTEGFDGLWNYKLISEKYQDGRKYWQTGLTEIGQRHEAVLAVEHYLWHGDQTADIPAFPGTGNDRVRCELIRAWLEQKHNGMCRHISRGNWRKVEAQIERACLWRRSPGQPQKREPYALTDRAIERLVALYKSTGRVWSIDDFRKGNEGRREIAREKIRTALELLTSQGRRVTLRQLMSLTGCNHHTVRRHSDIWRMYSEPISSVASDPNPFLGPDRLVLDLKADATGSVTGFKKENLFFFPSAGDSRPALDVSRNAETGAAVLSVTSLPFCQAERVSSEPESQDQDILVPAEVSTTEPTFGALEAHVHAAEVSSIALLESCCYTDATVSGIKTFSGAASVMGALLSFGTESKKEKIVLDANNFNSLTSVKNSFPSGIAGGNLSHFQSTNLSVVRPTGTDLSGLFVISQTYKASNSRRNWARAPPFSSSSGFF